MQASVWLNSIWKLEVNVTSVYSSSENDLLNISVYVFPLVWGSVSRRCVRRLPSDACSGQIAAQPTACLPACMVSDENPHP